MSFKCVYCQEMYADKFKFMWSVCKHIFCVDCAILVVKPYLYLQTNNLIPVCCAMKYCYSKLSLEQFQKINDSIERKTKLRVNRRQTIMIRAFFRHSYRAAMTTSIISNANENGMDNDNGGGGEDEDEQGQQRRQQRRQQQLLINVGVESCPMDVIRMIADYFRYLLPFELQTPSDGKWWLDDNGHTLCMNAGRCVGTVVFGGFWNPLYLKNINANANANNSSANASSSLQENNYITNGGLIGLRIKFQIFELDSSLGGRAVGFGFCASDFDRYDESCDTDDRNRVLILDDGYFANASDSVFTNDNGKQYEHKSIVKPLVHYSKSKVVYVSIDLVQKVGSVWGRDTQIEMNRQFCAVRHKKQSRQPSVISADAEVVDEGSKSETELKSRSKVLPDSVFQIGLPSNKAVAMVVYFGDRYSGKKVAVIQQTSYYAVKDMQRYMFIDN